MARIRKVEAQLVAIAAIVGIPVLLIGKAGEAVGWPLLVGLIIVATVIWFVANQVQKAAKQRALLAKYGDKEIVERLMGRMFWVGQSTEQLLDSLGSPEAIDQKVLKTKKKEIWKYNHRGGNRYGLRITLDNDEVVGWDKK